MSAPGLYPEFAPWRCHTLAVAHGHCLHVEESGTPDGICAVVLHGGPGSGGSPQLRRFFDPTRFHVIGIDQRGSGRSRPRGATQHNQTADLLDDLRSVRAQLGLPRWLVVGGSWGATLALAHALAEPEAVAALLLRAVFLPTRHNIAQFFQQPSVAARPAWARFVGVAPAERQGDMLGFLAQGLQQDGAPARRLALAWWRWEQAQAGSGDDGDGADSAAAAAAPDPGTEALDALVDRYRVQSHYLLQRCWLDAPPLLERLAALPRVPCLLLHARNDQVCSAASAQAVQGRIAHSALRWVDAAGHDPFHPTMAAAMRAALDRYARDGHFGDGA